MDSVLTARASGSGYVRLNKTILDVMSKEIMLQAQPLYVMNNFAIQKTELYTQPSLGVNFLQYTDLGGGGKLTESENIKSNSYDESLKSITVYEYGNAVVASELLLNSSFDNVMQTVVELLGRNNAKVVDNEYKDVILRATQIAYAPNMVTNAKTTSQAGITKECKFGSVLIKDAVEQLDTINTPRFNNEYFIGIASPHQLRSLSDDEYWEKANLYANTRALFTGERGELEGVRFVQTTQMSYLATGVAGTTATSDWDGSVYYGAIIGANAFGHAVSLPTEMRDGGVIDYGRKRGIAWYSIDGYDYIEENSIIVVKSA